MPNNDPSNPSSQSPTSQPHYVWQGAITKYPSVPSRQPALPTHRDLSRPYMGNRPNRSNTSLGSIPEGLDSGYVTHTTRHTPSSSQSSLPLSGHSSGSDNLYAISQDLAQDLAMMTDERNILVQQLQEMERQNRAQMERFDKLQEIMTQVLQRMSTISLSSDNSFDVQRANCQQLGVVSLAELTNVFPQLDREEYKNVHIWTKEDFHNLTARDIIIDDGDGVSDDDDGNADDETSSRPSTRRKIKPLAYIVNINGTPTDAAYASRIRSALYKILNHLGSVGRAADISKNLDSMVRLYIRNELYAMFKELRYCDDDWKFDFYLAQTYSKWLGPQGSRRRVLYGLNSKDRSSRGRSKAATPASSASSRTSSVQRSITSSVPSRTSSAAPSRSSSTAPSRNPSISSTTARSRTQSVVSIASQPVSRASSTTSGLTRPPSLAPPFIPGPVPLLRTNSLPSVGRVPTHIPPQFNASLTSLHSLIAMYPDPASLSTSSAASTVSPSDVTPAAPVAAPGDTVSGLEVSSREAGAGPDNLFSDESDAEGNPDHDVSMANSSAVFGAMGEHTLLGRDAEIPQIVNPFARAPAPTTATTSSIHSPPTPNFLGAVWQGHMSPFGERNTALTTAAPVPARAPVAISRPYTDTESLTSRNLYAVAVWMPQNPRGTRADYKTHWEGLPSDVKKQWGRIETAAKQLKLADASLTPITFVGTHLKNYL